MLGLTHELANQAGPVNPRVGQDSPLRPIDPDEGDAGRDLQEAVVQRAQNHPLRLRGAGDPLAQPVCRYQAHGHEHGPDQRELRTHQKGGRGEPDERDPVEQDLPQLHRHVPDAFEIMV